MSADRSIVLDRLVADLLGPKNGPEELLDERPSDRYLTGILFPRNTEVQTDDQSAVEVSEDRKSSAETSDEGGIALFRSIRPATMGISFAVTTSQGEAPKIEVTITCARYQDIEAAVADDGTAGGAEEGARTKLNAARKLTNWKRQPLSANIKMVLGSPITVRDLMLDGLAGLTLYVKLGSVGGKSTVTTQLINNIEITREEGRTPLERATFFQVRISIKPLTGTELAPRPVRTHGQDEESRSSALLFRRSQEYATGHNCSASWFEPAEGEPVHEVRSEWMPHFEVQPMNPDGDQTFRSFVAKTKIGNLSAAKMAECSKVDVIELLNALADGYDTWLGEVEASVKQLDPEYRKQAGENLIACRDGLNRIRGGIEYLNSDAEALLAFQLANRAMAIQRGWTDGHPDWKEDSGSDLIWRPFQLAFCLLTLPSVGDRSHADRKVLDLIWFPTGGGKTEAYLLVTAFCLFMRRLRNPNSVKGLGLGVLMRYTLRTLTVQQFQRAAALIAACESLRKSPAGARLGTVRFSIGLWVGNDSTPNRYIDARTALAKSSESTPAQISLCPACRFAKVRLVWTADDQTQTIRCRCPEDECKASECLGELPVLTVDDQIYRDPPSLLIGTVDKFAQIVRKKESGALFGIGPGYSPPDLIIQDELHLISGPLGTITGLYEIAIDALCSTPAGPPKIIGSTATIRRAKEQVKALFARMAFTFPPAAVDEANSCFATKDPSADGRLYVGITTAGRSDKFALQTVAASLLQSGLDSRMSISGRNAYSTLVAYFNSLRILGGALVAMQDDVPKTISALSTHRAEEPRRVSEPEELTSRKASSEIPKILEQLEIGYGDPDFIDILLASNMLSVGVDIPRLGLMVVNGQPKSMSEYIQATSRVGRSKQGPGLVVTIYNNNKIRDRAHYETFQTWHSALYRSVEPTSVTPFAPRARDKAIHAPLVAMARHQLGVSSARLSRSQLARIESEILPKIVSRVIEVDEREAGSTEEELREFLSVWSEREDLKFIWNDQAFNKSLLISAEKAAARRATGKRDAPARPTPNSVRNVEPSVDFLLRERLTNEGSK